MERSSQVIGRAPAQPLREYVSSYHGWVETAPGPVRRREGPGADIVVVVSFEHEWLIDGERFASFAAGLHDRQVTTEHPGRSYGMQIDLAPPAAHRLFRLPMYELAHREVALEDVLPDRTLVERLAETADWAARFELLDDVLAERIADAPPASPGVSWAWQRLRATHGRVPIGALAEELGWSRKRIVARFREHLGLPPKTVARLLRFERARALGEGAERPDWARIAAECGYYDQSHLIQDFRAVTGRTPATFFQAAARLAA